MHFCPTAAAEWTSKYHESWTIGRASVMMAGEKDSPTYMDSIRANNCIASDYCIVIKCDGCTMRIQF